MVKIPPIANLQNVTSNFRQIAVKILRRLKEIVSRLNKTEKLDHSFILPYSSDKSIKRQQVWDNLQKGILFEDKRVLIPWLTPFNQVDKFKEKRSDRGDRTNWYLGNRKILDGYEGQLEVMKWMWLPWTNSFERLSGHLGFGKDGHHNFLLLIEHLKKLLGDPSKVDIEIENENFTEGSYEWANGEVKIRVSGFDMHGSRYRFDIGLIKNRNEEYFKKTIEELKAGGLTDEELGK